MTKHHHTWALAASLLLVGLAQAQPAAATPPYVSAGVEASDDSDGFQEFKPWTQYETSNGWGARAGWQHYRQGDWSDTGRSLFVTHRMQQDAWSSNGRLGLNRTAGHGHIVGAWDGMYQWTGSTAAGVSAERDVVNSQIGLREGLTANTAMAVLDHQFHPRFGVGLAAGSTWFSDDNRRDILRSRWTFTLSEDQGWYLYTSTRHYRNSDPYRRAYFSPAHFREAALGVMWKTAITDEVAISANADMGRQYIDRDGQQLWHVGLYLSSRHRAPVQWKVGFAISKDHASALGGAAEGYRYTSAVASVRVPF